MKKLCDFIHNFHYGLELNFVTTWVQKQQWKDYVAKYIISVHYIIFHLQKLATKLSLKFLWQLVNGTINAHRC